MQALEDKDKDCDEDQPRLQLQLEGQAVEFRSGGLGRDSIMGSSINHWPSVELSWIELD